MEKVVRPFRPPIPQRPPWLVYFSHGKRGKAQSFFSIVEGRAYVRSIQEMHRKTCEMYSHGWLFMIDWRSEDCFLLNPASIEKIQLPPLPPDLEFPYDTSRCILSSPPTEQTCVVLFIDRHKPIIMYCHLSEGKWNMARFKLEEEGGIRDITTCRGKLYGLTYGERLVILDFHPFPVVRLLGEMPPASTLWGPYYVERLVESDGELFLVYKVFMGHSDLVLTFTVLKLDFSQRNWVQIQSIGDRAFFLCSGSSLSCSASSEAGIQGDCIYYVEAGDPSLYRFSLTDRSITMDLPCPNLQKPWYQPHWVFL